MAYPSRVSLELGVSGAHDASARGDVIVVIDALRATSTIVAALAEGVASVRPVATVEQCVGELTAGERGGRKIPHLDLDNSPLAFAGKRHQGKHLVLTSTNGTKCILAAGANPGATVLIGALLNSSAVAAAALVIARHEARNISVIVAGRHDDVAPEDVIVATEIIHALPTVRLLTSISPVQSDDFKADFLRSPSGVDLVRFGRTDDVALCATKDRYPITPFLCGQLIAIRQGSMPA